MNNQTSILSSNIRTAKSCVYLLLFTIICLTSFVLVNCQQSTPANPCGNKQNCRECIQTLTCGWCSKQNFTDKRCMPVSSESAKRCEGKYFYFPTNEYIIRREKQLTYGRKQAAGGGSHMTHTSSSSSFTSTSSQSGFQQSSVHHQEVVQIKPQHVQLKLRLNEEQKINFDYQQAEDYPVDLYYLMDLSQSMRDDKMKLSALGDHLAGNMSKLTSNFRLGFGSFVDKVVMPYVSTVPAKLERPCNDADCVPVYGFKNHMRLSENTQKFAGEVKSANVSGNLDAPEGGFDAIMQAVVCRNEIGWRDKARRLLVFSTDAGFHYAGDGKLGGIVKPNDGECHLDTAGYYTKSTEQDYPSISQINLKVKQNSINVIFAVVESELGIYKKLSENIEGSSYGMLSNDSSNVVDLVKDQYNKISSNIEMKDNAASNYLKVSYYSNCLNKSDPLSQSNKCDGLKVGDKVQFEVRVELKECPKNESEWRQTFKIYPVGINESLIIEVNMLCDCPCEYPGDIDLYEPFSPTCRGHGTLKCGMCECDTSHYGRSCECDNLGTGFGTDYSASCRADNATNVECSGRGSCVCGQCECYKRPHPDEEISGKFCECDNFSCTRRNGLLCSGSDHGTCSCGQCVCKDGWIHDDCSCANRTDTCIAKGSDQMCSGHGECVCGSCKCFEDDKGTRYSGRYCEKCTTCPRKCKELKDCVMCRAYQDYTKISEEECKTNCSWFELELVDTVTMVEEIHEDICYEENEEDCKFEYVYKYNPQGKIVVVVQKKPQCPPQVHVLGIVLGVIGAIVLIGLALLLVWKMLTTIQDRREFAKFEKQQMMAKWNTDENPIYKQATSTFKNPTYAGKMN